MIRRVMIAGAALPFLAAPLSAQTWRTVTESRRHMGEDTMSVNIAFGLGRLQIGPAAGPTLYRVGLVYDDDHFDPDIRYDAERRRLSAGVDKEEGRSFRFDFDDSRQRLTLALSPAVAVALSVEFGAGEATLDLGGLTLVSGRIRTGASESTVRFSTPNAGTCRRLTFEVGAAEFRGLQLGNARCASIRVNGGVGEIVLDLSGAWDEGEHRVRADVGLGEVRVEVPRNAGIRLEIHRFLAGFDHPGFTKRGSYYYSANYSDAPVKLLVELHATFGNIEVGWAEN